MKRRDVVLDSESEWDEEVSVRNMCMKSYMDRSKTFLWSIVTDGYQWAGTPQEFAQNYEAQAIVCDPNSNPWAVNSNFDFEWFKRNFPDLKTNNWQCVSDYSVYHQRPRALEHMYKALFGEKFSKQARQDMKGVKWNDVFPFVQDEWKGYNLGDSLGAKRCLTGLRELGPMSATEVAVAAHTRMVCRRGIAMDGDYIEKCRQQLEIIRFNVKKDLPWVKDGEPPMSVQGFNTFSCKHNVAPPANLRKGDEDFTDWMEANPSLAPTLKARQRYELANRKLQHIEKFLSRVHEGIYYPDLLYCGAPHTRRFSAKGSSDGAQTDDATHSGFNVQNMDREPIFGDLLPEFVSPLPPIKGGKPQPGIFVRNFLVPRVGKKFIVLDFNQIEPRCLAWLVGAEDFLDMVRAGYSVYEAHARSRLGWTGGDLKTEDPNLYRMAKAQVLGLGYQCGVRKFPAVAWSMARLRISAEESEKAVYGYRNANPLIADRDTGIWARMQRLCMASSQSQEPLEIDLPNGETMRYFGVNQYTRYDEQGNGRFAYSALKTLGSPDPRNIGDIYGGRLTENVTQRFARDVLVEAALRVEKAGMPVCFHTHDELIAEVDADNANDALQEAIQLMQVVPDWCAGLPVAVSGGVYNRYCKAD